MSDRQVRWARQKLQARAGGPVIKCRMCKTTWLYGSNRMRGVCNKCAKIALDRNNMQVIARGRPGVVNAGWSINDWPGRLKVKYKLDDDTYVDKTISYEDAMTYKGDIGAWVDSQWKVVQDEHAAELD